MNTSKMSNFNINSSVREDWDGGYALEINLTAKSNADDWKLSFDLPYKISETYGVDLVANENGSYTIYGQNDQKSLMQGQSIKPVFVIEDGGKDAKIPEFHTQDSMMSESTVKTGSETKSQDSMMSESKMESEPETKSQNSMMSESEMQSESEAASQNPMMSESEMQSKPKTASDNYTPGNLENKPNVSEDWEGGYKLEVDLTAKSQAENWQATFQLPYEIRDTYGVDIIDNDDGSYTISGLNGQKTLQQGQSIKPIFIVEDGGQEAIMPEFIAADAEMTESKEMTKSEEMNEDNSMMSDGVTNSSEDIGISSQDNSQVIVEDPQGESVKQKGQFAYGEALQKNFLFYEANRSGDLGPYHRLVWRDDATTGDGDQVGRNLEGGYFDAGDHVKFGQPMAASVNMLAWGGVEYREAYERSGQLDELLETIKWGTDYFLKAHEVNGDGETSRFWVQVGEGQFDHNIWVAPSEVEEKTPRNAFAVDPNSPGSDITASTAGALASSSMLFSGIDDEYADKLLRNAEQLFEFAEKYQGKYSDSVEAASPYYTSYSGYYDELASSAVWLYKATGEESYLTKAEDYFKNNIVELGDWTWATDDHSYSAAVLLAQESDDPMFKDIVEEWGDKWINGEGNIQYTDGGFAFRAEWASVPVTSSAAFLLELYNDTVREDSRYSDFATSQVDYILGDNPLDYSYMIGFGENYPERPHHRGSSPNLDQGSDAPQENILYGAIVGGPDAADDYAHNDRRDDYVTNEVGISYNAPFASAVIQQYDNFGGDPLSQAELDQLIGVDANGVGF